ncbi:MAG: hypothetical protein ACOCSC_03860 [Candidatus Hadarchaeota archaeon]
MTSDRSKTTETGHNSARSKSIFLLIGGYAFSKAYKGMKWEIEKHNWSGFREGFKKTSNVSTLTAFTVLSTRYAQMT